MVRDAADPAHDPHDNRAVKEQAYAAARDAAPAVRRHLEYHVSEARTRGEPNLPDPPDEHTIARLIDAAFWASLQREEGHAPRISLAFIPPEVTGHAMRFERWLPMTPHALAKLAPAVERPGIHLGVWPDGDGLRVWGTTRTVPHQTFVLEVVEPGLVVLKYRRGDEFDKFGTIAVLRGDRVQVVDEKGASLPDCPQLLTSLLGFEAPLPAIGSTNVLIQLAVSMRARPTENSLVVRCDLGTVRANLYHGFATIERGAPSRLEKIGRPIVASVQTLGTALGNLGARAARGEPAYPGLRELVRRFHRACAGRTPSPISVEESIDVARARDSIAAMRARIVG